MLEALGLKASEKRWKAAGKLQQAGKVKQKAVLEYLEFGAREIASVESAELIARMKLDKNGPEDIQQAMNTWQCQLIENRGWEVNFGRKNISELIEKSGQAGQPGSDAKVVQAVSAFECAIRAAMTVGVQEAGIREKLGLRADGEEETEADSGALLPRRYPKKEGKLQVTGPIVRSKLEELLKEARSMVMSLRTRELLAGVMKDYATWKPQALVELCSMVVIRWQEEVFEHHGIDRRLVLLEIAAPRTESPGVFQAQQGLIQACAGLTMWYTMRPKPSALPDSAGVCRRVEALSRIDGDAADGEDRQLLQDGEPDPEVVLKCLRGIRDEFATDSFGDETEKAAATGDLMCVERWTRELYEAYGIHHDFGQIAANSIAMSKDVEALNAELVDLTKDKIRLRIAAGLRRSLEAKKKAAAEAEGASRK